MDLVNVQQKNEVVKLGQVDCLFMAHHGVLEGVLGRRWNLGWNLSAGH